MFYLETPIDVHLSTASFVILQIFQTPHKKEQHMLHFPPKNMTFLIAMAISQEKKLRHTLRLLAANTQEVC